MTREEIWLMNPTVGSEIRKTRPCVVVSPAEMHDYLRTELVAPMTTVGRKAPFRIGATHSRRKGMILPDQVRAMDKTRFQSGDRHVKGRGFVNAGIRIADVFVGLVWSKLPAHTSGL